MNKGYYAVLREAVTPGSPETQRLQAGLRERLAGLSLPDIDLAVLKPLYGLVMREAEVLTVNTLVSYPGAGFLPGAPTDALGPESIAGRGR